jgi:hypothetical protein
MYSKYIMYNVNFNVKYHDINQDLLRKVKNGLINKSEYSENDITNICNKLYRDELVSVFYAENIIDDRIDEGIKYISEQLLFNNEFNLIMTELRSQFLKYMLDIVGEPNNNMKNIDFIIFITLFSEKIFHIMHKCICQQLTQQRIDSDLLKDLKNLAIESLSE